MSSLLAMESLASFCVCGEDGVCVCVLKIKTKLSIGALEKRKSSSRSKGRPQSNDAYY